MEGRREWGGLNVGGGGGGGLEDPGGGNGWELVDGIEVGCVDGEGAMEGSVGGRGWWTQAKADIAIKGSLACLMREMGVRGVDNSCSVIRSLKLSNVESD